jgi:hypothetical protein
MLIQAYDTGGEIAIAIMADPTYRTRDIAAR